MFIANMLITIIWIAIGFFLGIGLFHLINAIISGIRKIVNERD